MLKDEISIITALRTSGLPAAMKFVLHTECAALRKVTVLV
jgi:hypothetical protein